MNRAEAIQVLEVVKYCDVDEVAKIKAVDMAIAALSEQKQSKWISVKERLPEEHKTVLVLCKNGAMFTGYQSLDYNDDVRWRIHTALSSTKLLNKGRVTHWLYLPELPNIKSPKIGAAEE